MDEQIDKKIVTILRSVNNLEEVTVKDVRKRLERELGVNLKKKKHFISDRITAFFLDGADTAKTGKAKAKPKKEKDTSASAKSKVKTSATKAKAATVKAKPVKSKRKTSKTWLAVEPEPKKAKEKEVIPQSVEEADELLAHQLAHEELGLRRRATSTILTPQRKRKGKHSDSADGEAGDEPKKEKKKRNVTPALLSPALSTFLGADKMAKGDVTRKIWAYIKKHNLQDPSDKRYIVCDAALKAVLKRDRIHMFKLSSVLAEQTKDPRLVVK